MVGGVLELIGMGNKLGGGIIKLSFKYGGKKLRVSYLLSFIATWRGRNP
jgi:hypothetical protein